MGTDSRQVLLLEKRVELLEKYQTEMLLHILHKQQQVKFIQPPNKSKLTISSLYGYRLKIRRFILRRFSFIDRRLIKYIRYNKIRIWIYKRYK